TSFRPLTDISPDVFKKQYMSVFSSDMYLPPAQPQDMHIILETLCAQYHVTLENDVKESLVSLAGGYVQYLQLAVIHLSGEKKKPKTQEELLGVFTLDEQFTLQSEELFDSLTKREKEIVLQIHAGNRLTARERDEVPYLWNTGMVYDEEK